MSGSLAATCYLLLWLSLPWPHLPRQVLRAKESLVHAVGRAHTVVQEAAEQTALRDN